MKSRSASLGRRNIPLHSVSMKCVCSMCICFYSMYMLTRLLVLRMVLVISQDTAVLELEQLLCDMIFVLIT